jgi:hypothetical protein
LSGNLCGLEVCVCIKLCVAVPPLFGVKIIGYIAIELCFRN